MDRAGAVLVADDVGNVIWRVKTAASSDFPPYVSQRTEHWAGWEEHHRGCPFFLFDKHLKFLAWLMQMLWGERLTQRRESSQAISAARKNSGRWNAAASSQIKGKSIGR
jgi:hypothetical protein